MNSFAYNRDYKIIKAYLVSYACDFDYQIFCMF